MTFDGDVCLSVDEIVFSDKNTTFIKNTFIGDQKQNYVTYKSCVSTCRKVCMKFVRLKDCKIFNLVPQKVLFIGPPTLVGIGTLGVRVCVCPENSQCLSIVFSEILHGVTTLYGEM